MSDLNDAVGLTGSIDLDTPAEQGVQDLEDSLVAPTGSNKASDLIEAVRQGARRIFSQRTTRRPQEVDPAEVEALLAELLSQLGGTEAQQMAALSEFAGLNGDPARLRDLLRDVAEGMRDDDRGEFNAAVRNSVLAELDPVLDSIDEQGPEFKNELRRAAQEERAQFRAEGRSTTGGDGKTEDELALTTFIGKTLPGGGEDEESPSDSMYDANLESWRRFRETDRGSIARVMQARAEAQEAALERATQRQGQLSNAVGMSADMVSRTDRFFVRTSDGTVVGQDGVPITEARMQMLLVENGMQDSEQNRNQIVLQAGQRSQVLGGDGQRLGSGVPTQEITRENLGGHTSVAALEGAAQARGVQTDSEGNVVTDINGQPMPGSDAMVPRTYQAYTAADAARPRSRSAEEIGMLQAELVRAGYLTADLIWGRWDSSTQDAYQSMLTYANINGIEERQAFAEGRELFNDNIRNAVSDYRRSVEEQATRAVNMSSVQESVREYFSTYLNGRTPSASEMEAWTTELADLWRAQAQQERDAAMAEQGNQIDPRLDIPDEFGGPGEGAVELEDPEGLNDPAVDPQAQFAERFRGVYENEMAGIRSREENDRTSGLLGSIGSGLISRSGGGIR